MFCFVLFCFVLFCFVLRLALVMVSIHSSKTLTKTGTTRGGGGGPTHSEEKEMGKRIVGGMTGTGQ